MTRLWIDGQEAVLPRKFTIQVKAENPFFTRGGEYTYDITLSLTPPANAALYGHLSRLNRTGTLSTGRKAVLMADNRVYCNGTEIITGWTSTEVTLQIAGGNSELNYLIGGDRRIETLTLKSEGLAMQQASFGLGNRDTFIDMKFPNVLFCLPALAMPDSSAIVNNWGANTHALTPYAEEGTYIQQPYLMGYIHLVAQALGYTVRENQLADTPYRNLYILNGEAGTNNWSLVLHGWTVSEFFSQIERLFNAVIVVDNRTRQLSIVLKRSFYHASAINHVRLVEDAYEATVEEDSDIEDPARMTIHYSGSSSGDFWKWQRLDEEIVNVARKAEIPADYPDGSYVRPYEFFLEAGNQRRDTLFTDATNGRQYLYIGDPFADSTDHEYNWDKEPPVRYRLVNQLADCANRPDSDSYDLDIQPAAMVWMQACRDHTAGKTILVSIPQLPSFRDHTESEDVDLAGIVTGSQRLDSDQKATFALAFYDGPKGLDTRDGQTFTYPMSYVTDVMELPCRLVLSYRDSNSEGATLAPSRLNELFYRYDFQIDYTRCVKLKSHDPNVFSPSCLFEAGNKRYVCKELEYTLDAEGRKGAWTATLYPVIIADAETASDWILKDGRWRDAGVWIDNGRWLDG